MRLFFDLLKQESPSYDFHGHDVGKPDDAAQIAELIAADLGWSETSDWVGSQVVVRDTAGKLLFAVPIVCAAQTLGSASLTASLKFQNRQECASRVADRIPCRRQSAVLTDAIDRDEAQGTMVECSLSGVKRTLNGLVGLSANDAVDGARSAASECYSVIALKREQGSGR